MHTTTHRPSPAALRSGDSEPRKAAQLPRFFRWFSEHCVLRQIDASDVGRIWTAVLHPAYERCWTVAIPRNAAEVAQLVSGAHADWQRGSRYTVAVLRKQTQEFVGWVEARATEKRAAWLLDWFIHPRFLDSALSLEALTAAAELMFKALDAKTLYVNCPAGQGHFERLLNEAGFIELVPAGSLDLSGRPRAQALYELGQRDWARMTGAACITGPLTAPKLELQLI